MGLLADTAARKRIRRARLIAGSRGFGGDVPGACVKGIHGARSAGTPRGRYGGRTTDLAFSLPPCSRWGIVISSTCRRRRRVAPKNFSACRTLTASSFQFKPTKAPRVQMLH